MPSALPQLLTDLLREVSRSFYLTLRVLPGAIRAQIGLAYLLARATDTIADTSLVAIGERQDCLNALRERILGNSRAPVNFGKLTLQQALPAERSLLERIEEVLELLQNFSAEDQHKIRHVLQIIISGQTMDLVRFAGASETRVVALKTGEELDDYTYRVAGCVGEFWTGMCRTHLFPHAALDDAKLLAQSVRFGKGLQLVNILRDLPRDLQAGRCYLPLDALQPVGLSPADLLVTKNQPRFRPVYEGFLAQAESHLAAGWDYTNALPFGQGRVRLACAWPVLIGIQTVGRLRKEEVLDAGQRVKISRQEVRGIVLRSMAFCGWPSAWKALFAHYKNQAR